MYEATIYNNKTLQQLIIIIIVFKMISREIERSKIRIVSIPEREGNRFIFVGQLKNISRALFF
jgi:hypothetical protein